MSSTIARTTIKLSQMTNTRPPLFSTPSRDKNQEPINLSTIIFGHLELVWCT